MIEARRKTSRIPEVEFYSQNESRKAFSFYIRPFYQVRSSGVEGGVVESTTTSGRGGMTRTGRTIRWRSCKY